MSTPVEHLCRIPRNFRSGDKSLLQLVVESNIRQQPGELTELAVREVLVRDPTLVEDWFAYSDDKRTSGGWYLVQRENLYVVGAIGGERLSFDDVATACAAFVVRELDPIVRGSF